jgi:hypothetical protein
MFGRQNKRSYDEKSCIWLLYNTFLSAYRNKVVYQNQISLDQNIKIDILFSWPIKKLKDKESCSEFLYKYVRYLFSRPKKIQ